MDYGKIKLAFDQNSIKYTYGTTKNGKKVVTCILRYKVKPGTIDGPLENLIIAAFDIRDNDKKYALSGFKTCTAIGKAVLEDNDTYDPKIGEKVARVKAENTAYQTVMKAMMRFINTNSKKLWDTVIDFVDRGCNVYSHNEEYLRKLVNITEESKPDIESKDTKDEIDMLKGIKF